jgi:ribosomal protein S12 methylthiotransferase accessory factor
MRPLFQKFGITRLADITGLDEIGIPVWSAIRPNARTLAVSQGKGVDAPAAQASAVMEAVEMAVAERVAIPTRRMTAAALAQDGGAVESLPDLVAQGRPPLLDDEEIDWAAGYDISADRTVWVPLDAVRLDQPISEREASRYWRSSDGLASGNLLIEAALHGVLERIERDAMALWRLRSDGEVRQRCVVPTAFGDPILSDLVARVEGAGLGVHLFDVTTDVDVPVFFCVIAPRGSRKASAWKYLELVSGSGCHPLPARAAIRALTEAVQSRLTVISGARDDIIPAAYDAPLSPDLLAYLAVEPAKSPAGRDSRGEPLPREMLLAGVVEKLRAVGLGRVIVVPLSGHSEEFAVAKMIVPGLEHPAGARRTTWGRRALSLMMAPR